MQSKAQIDQVLRQKSEAKEIPGVVAMAATAREVIYQGAFGKRDLSRDDAMTADSVFWIASMSKAVTAAGAMQLVEQGKLSLDAPIGKVLPDLAAPQVLEGFDAKGEPMSKSRGNFVSPRDVAEKWGADMVRLWVASQDYFGDVRYSEAAMTQLSETYRKLRNTFRFALSNLADFDPSRDALPDAKLWEMDAWMLRRTGESDINHQL